MTSGGNGYEKGYVCVWGGVGADRDGAQDMKCMKEISSDGKKQKTLTRILLLNV